MSMQTLVAQALATTDEEREAARQAHLAAQRQECIERNEAIDAMITERFGSMDAYRHRVAKAAAGMNGNVRKATQAVWS